MCGPCAARCVGRTGNHGLKILDAKVRVAVQGEIHQVELPNGSIHSVHSM